MVDMATFKKDLKKDLAAGRKIFEGKYSVEVNELLGLSRTEIDEITPDAVDLQVYDQLITVVKLASRHNLSQAQLADNIKTLGTVAVSIAKKCGSIAKYLV